MKSACNYIRTDSESVPLGALSNLPYPLRQELSALLTRTAQEISRRRFLEEELTEMERQQHAIRCLFASDGAERISPFLIPCYPEPGRDPGEGTLKPGEVRADVYQVMETFYDWYEQYIDACTDGEPVSTLADLLARLLEMKERFLHLCREAFPEPGARQGLPPESDRTLCVPDDHGIHDLGDLGEDEFEEVLETLEGEVVAASRVFTDDTLLVRYIGARPSGNNKLAGSFWSIGPPFQNEADWRRLCAVKGTWNGDGTYEVVRFGDLPEDVKAEILRYGLAGAAAPQPSMVDGHYLEGGGLQLWIPEGILDLERITGESPQDFLQPSAWHHTRKRSKSDE